MFLLISTPLGVYIQEAQPIKSQSNLVTRVPAGLQNGVLPKFDKFPRTEMKPATNFSNNSQSSQSSTSRGSTSQHTTTDNRDNQDSQTPVKSYHDDSDVVSL